MNGRVKAIVLKRINYGEADRIIDLITPEGQLSAIVKGARREKSKLAGGIELLSVNDITIRQGRSGLATVTSARMDRFFDYILGDYDRLQFAYSAIRLVAKASRDIDGPDWFSVLEQTLTSLNQPKINRLLVETWFFIHYASLLGDELNLRSDDTGSPLAVDSIYVYDEMESALRADSRGIITGDHIKLLRLIMAKPLATLSQVGGIDLVIADCWLVARQHAAV